MRPKKLLGDAHGAQKTDNYQTMTSPSLDVFAYEEFSGRDGRTCPTCHGTGRISKDQENDLVALIPYNDDRLKPSKTKQYVILAVVLCLVVSGLCLFFVLPRSILISPNTITNYTVSIEDNQTTTYINLKYFFKVQNNNFFNIQVLNITADANYGWPGTKIGSGYLTKSLSVPSLSTVETSILVRTVFDDDNHLTYVSRICTQYSKDSHDLVMQFNIMMTSSYLKHSEENSIKTYEYINCGNNIKHIH